MRKMLVIAVREYLAAVRTKTFLITLVIMPVLMGGSIFVQWLLRDFRDTKTKHFAVVDRTPDARLYPSIARTVQAYNETTKDPATHKAILPRFEVEQVPASANTKEAIAEQRLELSERVRNGDLFGFLEIGREILEPSEGQTDKQKHAIRYQSNRPTNLDFPRLIEEPLLYAVQDVRMEETRLPLPREKIRQIMRSARVEAMGLTRRDPGQRRDQDGTLQSRIAPVAVPIGFDDVDVHGHHDDGHAADARRGRGEDAAHRRGAARLGATLRSDARQTARHDGGVADDHGRLPGRRLLGGARVWLHRVHLRPICWPGSWCFRRWRH